LGKVLCHKEKYRECQKVRKSVESAYVKKK